MLVLLVCTAIAFIQVALPLARSSRMSEEGHTLKKGRSLGSTVNSEMSTNKIVDYALKFKAAVNFFFLSRFHTLRTSRTGMLLLPLLVTLVTAGASAAVVIVPTALSLPSIMWYDQTVS